MYKNSTHNIYRPSYNSKYTILFTVTKAALHAPQFKSACLYIHVDYYAAAKSQTVTPLDVGVGLIPKVYKLQT